MATVKQHGGYDWLSFSGSHAAIKWNRRDLPYLDRVVSVHCRAHRIAVQAGGNFGIYPKRLAETFGAVYTFEPASDLFVHMLRNAPEPNIYRFQAALGSRRELVGLSRERRDGKPDPHEGITHVSGSGLVPTMLLDDLALPMCDLVALDVEGYELEALRGAEATIARTRPVLFVEVNKNATLAGHGEEAVRTYIRALGYSFIERLGSDEVYVPNEWTD